MKFIAKELPLTEIEVGDVIEYTYNQTITRFMVVKVFDEEGLWSYELFDFEKNEVLEQGYGNLDDIAYEYKKFKDFRIIKSKNLELREV